MRRHGVRPGALAGAVRRNTTVRWRVHSDGGAARRFQVRHHFRPFVGAGVGSRTYDYKDRQTKNTSCVAGYASLGAEIRHRVIAVRSEARDYLSCFQSPISGERRTRNDLGLTIGLVYHIR
jgi:hypothetical protein